MQAMKKKWILILFLVFISCEKKAFNTTYDIRVSIEVLIQRDDVLQLFYNDSFFNDYNESYSQSKKIAGSPSFQKITFNLANHPKRIRIDLGNDSLQSSIRIKNITFFSKNKSITFESDKIARVFEFNEGIDFNPLTQEAKLKSVNGYYDPFLISKNLIRIINVLDK